MNLNKFTQKAQDAVLQAQHLAEEMNHSQIEAVHLLAALLAQQDGVVPQIVNRIGASGQLLAREVEARLNSLPRAVGAGGRPGWGPGYSGATAAVSVEWRGLVS